MAETKKKSPAAKTPKEKSKTDSKSDTVKTTLTAAAEAKAKKSSDSAGDSTSGDTPADYSIGEGQKQVTKKYRQGWDAIFTKKH